MSGHIRQGISTARQIIRQTLTETLFQFLFALTILLILPGAQLHEASEMDPPSCESMLRTAKEAPYPLQRSFAFRRMKDCPRSPDIRERIFDAIRLEDHTVRYEAIAVLEYQITEEDGAFLADQLYRDDLSDREKSFLYKNMKIIAGPTNQSLLEPQFVRGLYSEDPSIRIYSIEGLARLKSFHRWKRIREFLSSTSVEERVAAIGAARSFQPTDAGQLIKPMLLSGEPVIQKEVILYLSSTGTPSSLNDLLSLNQRDLHGENADLLWEKIGDLLKELYPESRAALTKNRTRIYEQPGEQHSIIGALKKGSIVYSDRHTRNRFSRKGFAEEQSALWRHVITVNGLSGWVHGSDIRLIP